MRFSPKAILFDLDDTLVVEVAAAEAAFLATCELAREKHGLDPKALHRTLRKRAREIWHDSPTHPYCRMIGVSSWEGMWGRFQGDDPDLQKLGKWVPNYRREAWTAALADFGVNDPILAGIMAEDFPKERRLRHQRFPDVDVCLNALYGKIPLALITNGASDLQREKIIGAGLKSYFDPIVVAGDLRSMKPDPAIFLFTLEKLQLKPQDTMMIGDSAERDVVGAQKLGIYAIWLNRNSAPCPPDIHPDEEIQSLDALTKRFA